jgi:hypothetical protein
MDRARARDRQFTAGVLGAAVLVTGTLLLLHRPSAEVLVDTKSSTVSFTVAAPFAPLRGVAQVAFAEFAGLAKVREEGALEIAAPPGDDLRLRVQPDITSKNPGAIGFDSLVVPEGAQIDVSQTGAPNSIELRIQYPAGASPTLDLDASGDVVLRVKDRRQASFPAPIRITAVPAGDAQLVVAFRAPQVTLPAPVPIKSISLSRETRSLALHPGGTHPESSILSGKLSLEEFKDRFINLRNGELLQLGGASGVIRQLRLEGDTFSSQFDGAVKELSTGEGDRKKNLMPTWLDWLRQRDALVQFWGAALYLSGLGWTVGRWCRGSK